MTHAGGNIPEVPLSRAEGSKSTATRSCLEL